MVVHIISGIELTRQTFWVHNFEEDYAIEQQKEIGDDKILSPSHRYWSCFGSL